jgi:putative resolvase
MESGPSCVVILSDPDGRVIVVEASRPVDHFGVEQLQAALSAQARWIVVDDPGESTDDLVCDKIEVVTSMCAGLEGRRGAQVRAMRAIMASKRDPGDAA